MSNSSFVVLLQSRFILSLVLLYCRYIYFLCYFPASGNFPSVTHLCVVLPHPLVYKSQAFRRLVPVGVVYVSCFSIQQYWLYAALPPVSHRQVGGINSTV